MIDHSLMRFDEKVVIKLRSLYKRYGYLPYKMSKFEEYELYIRNKDFLVSDRILAFNDTNGKLMALKPDVTLSIIKNGDDTEGSKQKVFYNENVYRVSESTHRFKEIMQTGLECIGDVDIYDIYEVISLAAESLAAVCDDFYIEISNMDVVTAVISSVCAEAGFVSSVLSCISEKNPHDLKKVCDEFGADENGYEKIAKLITLYGEREKVVEGIFEITDCPEVYEMAKLSDMLEESPLNDKIKFDFSVINDMNYYNGFVFKGFVNGVFTGVLAGGQYDNMMKKMDRTAGAIGFALYLDRLEELDNEIEEYDVDVLLIYDDGVDSFEVAYAVNGCIAEGKTVSAQKVIPEKLRYKEIRDLRKKD